MPVHDWGKPSLSSHGHFRHCRRVAPVRRKQTQGQRALMRELHIACSRPHEVLRG